jgi:hypothetical protein
MVPSFIGILKKKKAFNRPRNIQLYVLEVYHEGPSAGPAETRNLGNRLGPEASGEG